MAGCATVASSLVLLWRTEWSHVPAVKHGDRLKAEAEADAAAAAADAEEGGARRRLPLVRKRTLAQSFMRAMAEGGNGECLLLCPEDIR